MNNMTNNAKPKKNRTMIAILVAIIVGSVFLDQLTKQLTLRYLLPEGLAGSVHLWEDVFHLTYVRNYGAAWGMLADHRWVFMTFSTVAIIGLSVYLFGFSKDTNWVKISLAMIIGGGIGNMIDRIWRGFVVDFLDFTLIDFPVFNVADSFVCVGAGLMALWMIRSMMDEVRAEKAAMAASDEVGEAASDEVVEEMTDVVTETDQADAEATVEVAEEVAEETFKETSKETSKEDSND